MRHSGLVLVTGFALLGAGPAGSADPDSAKATLQNELGSLLREIERPPAVDLFEDGRRPDLVVLSSQSVMGEVTPCG
jgi:hypothetical protein